MNRRRGRARGVVDLGHIPAAVGHLVLGAHARRCQRAVSSASSPPLAFVALSTAGMLVASRRPESPFGWIISAYGLLVGIEGVAIGYRPHGSRPAAAGRLGDGTAAAWLGTWIAPVANALLTLALLLVPDGRLPSPRWRPVAWFVVASAVLGAVSGSLAAGVLVNGQPNPLAIAGAGDLLPQLRSLSRTLLLIGFAAAVVSLAVRFRVRTGEERQQLKWVAAGAWCGCWPPWRCGSIQRSSRPSWASST